MCQSDQIKKKQEMEIKQDVFPLLHDNQILIFSEREIYIEVFKLEEEYIISSHDWEKMRGSDHMNKSRASSHVPNEVVSCSNHNPYFILYLSYFSKKRSPLPLIIYTQLTIISMSAAENDYLINNNRRYEVTIPKYSRQQDYILYQAIILDTAFSLASTFSFRFKTLKKLHEQMVKQKTIDALPEFPRTKSFALWNRTNEDPKMIQERIRDLEYYLTKLLNCSHLQDLREMQQIRRTICSSRPQRRLSAEVKTARSEKEAIKQIIKECPEFYRRQSTAPTML